MDLAGWLSRRRSILQQSPFRQPKLSKHSMIETWNFDVGDVVRIRIIYEKDNRFV